MMICSLSSLWKYHWQSTRESAREKELKVAHVVGEEDLLVEDIDGELDLVELGPLISIPQPSFRIPPEPAAIFQGGSEPAKTLILQQVLDCDKTPQI